MEKKIGNHWCQYNTMNFTMPQYSLVQSLSHVRLFATSWIAARQASLSITNSRSSQNHIHRVGNAIQPSHPLSSTPPPVTNPSQHQSLPMSQLFAWDGQSTGVSTLASFLPKNTQDWSPLAWTGWISLQSKGLLGVLSNTTVQKHQFFSTHLSFGEGTLLQYSCLENSTDGGGWWAAVHGVAESRTWLSDFTFTFHFHALEKEMQSTPVFLPGESQGWGSLVGCYLWGRIESDTTEVT